MMGIYGLFGRCVQLCLAGCESGEPILLQGGLFMMSDYYLHLYHLDSFGLVQVLVYASAFMHSDLLTDVGNADMLIVHEKIFEVLAFHQSIQIDKVQYSFHQWKQTPENTGEYVHLTKELLTSCESIQWQVDELDKAVSVAERDPAFYGLNEAEIGRRRSWTSTARNQVLSLRRNVEAGRKKILFGHSTNPSESIRSKKHISQDNDEFIASESDQQMLLIKRQDEELDALSASVQRIGGVGLTIHDELVGQEKLLGELNLDMETTSNRLDFVQKRVAMVMKKASLKGQIMMIAFLVILFIILFVLVFLT
ncbi:hypothetical protein GQ55_8G039700 [Panicum hallii var. hallii]|uniref:t-SNARE coiled-coil homology domain-containing protein n=1 Tax=Panicum hallii var. hallii TaxID=1504633 RepID=A0A2T7CKJ9_9POAL|nr:hypothetical protein GQ55_8G039700 [Panicum hallii var. hallii]